MIQEVHFSKSKVQFSFWAWNDDFKKCLHDISSLAHGVFAQSNLLTFGMHSMSLHFNYLKDRCILNIFDRWTNTRICHNKYVLAKAKQAAMLDFNCTLLFSIHTNTLILYADCTSCTCFTSPTEPSRHILPSQAELRSLTLAAFYSLLLHPNRSCLSLCNN